MIGDFNAKSNDWCSIDITSFEGSELDFLTSHFGLSQIIKKLTVILDNSRSCIDLIFTSQPNMVIDSGVHTSLHSNCHHQMIYAKLDLKIIFLPPYERTVWHFKNANCDHIKRVISFITNETITCDDRDPPWMNSFIKTLIRTKDNFYKILRLLSINHKILSAFDIGLEVGGSFLDVSKAFDKIWQAGLIYKLRRNGICGDLINILNDILTNRKQTVVLNGQCSSWVDILEYHKVPFLGLLYF